MLLPSANFSSHGRGRWRGFAAQYEPASAGAGAGIRLRAERDATVVFLKIRLRDLFIRLAALFPDNLSPDCFQVFSLRHHEKAFAGAAAFPHCADGAFFLRLGIQVFAFVFNDQRASVV